ncbi:MAG: ABC transporter ATP-binding protein [Candidatus Bipolaricaulota bacterium]|nr:MAG: ABC transporter ATP-binding protein [Candidatus Bipolaricaulota bacterium]
MGLRPGRGAHMFGGERAKDARGSLRRLLGYLRRYRAAIVTVFVLATFGTSMALLGPYLMGRAIDLIVTRQGMAAVLRVLLAMLGCYGVAWLANAAQGVLIATVAQRAMREIRADLFAHLQGLSLRFHDSRRAGETMSRLTNDIDAISRVLSQNVTQLFSGLLTMLGILLVMFILSPWLALASMVVLPLMFGLVVVVGRKTRSAFRAYQKNLGVLNGTLEETFSGQRVVTAFGQEDRVLSRFDVHNTTVRRLGIHAMTYALFVMPMMGILSNMNVAVVAGIGGWLTVRGAVTVGLITTFIAYSRRFAEPLRQLGGLYNQVQQALAGAERIFEILDEVPDLVDSPNARALGTVRGEVSFEDVTFAYEPGVDVLKDITLRATPGEVIALVGPTGAGKTTVVNLLGRFYDIAEGVVRLDGEDVRGVTAASLRRQLGVVLQQTFLFAESVQENIRYGRLDATDAEVVEAARLANADGFIRRLPDGYDTELSERGANLSEGQRQLLSIARAVLADPRVLILDEATSSVDTRTETQIQEALQELMKGRTSLIIAHRLSTIRSANRILVIDNGRIVEQGDHAELLAAEGAYYRLYLSQFRGAAPPKDAWHTSRGEGG